MAVSPIMRASSSARRSPAGLRSSPAVRSAWRRTNTIMTPPSGMIAAERGALLQSLDDAEIALGRIVEHLERRLIGRTVVARDRGGHALEFDDHHALLDAGLIGLRRHAARQKFSASRRQCRPGQLGIGRYRVRI